MLCLVSLSFGEGWGVAHAQINLVPNGDFESFSTCTPGAGLINIAVPWYDPNNSSSDYYNGCSMNSSVGIPCQANCAYYQYPHSGYAYAALEGAIYTVSNYREYIQVQLTNVLTANKCYYAEFYTNKTNSDKYAVNNIGAYISSTAITCPTQTPYYLTPQILLSGNPVISDTLNWVKIFGIYQALGGENFLTIGNFQSDSNTIFQIIDNSSPFTEAAYYIDDVSMYEIPNANAGRDTTICNGDSVQLGITNYEGVTYNWQPTTGLSYPDIGNPWAHPTHTTTYYLTQTTPCSPIATMDSVVVTIGNCTVGAGELGTRKEELGISPNPATTNLTLTLTNGSGIVSLYNVLGEEVLSLLLTKEKTEVDVSSLAQGVYFVEVKTENGELRKKFVKQ